MNVVRVRAFSVAAAVVAVPLCGCAREAGDALKTVDVLNPAAVIASSRHFDKLSISVTGTVSNFAPAAGAFERYDLCTGEFSERWCIAVLDYRNPRLRTGEETTVRGTYRDEIDRGSNRLANVVIVRR